MIYSLALSRRRSVQVGRSRECESDLCEHKACCMAMARTYTTADDTIMPVNATLDHIHPLPANRAIADNRITCSQQVENPAFRNAVLWWVVAFSVTTADA